MNTLRAASLALCALALRTKMAYDPFVANEIVRWRLGG